MSREKEDSNSKKIATKAFTLIELLIVIAIIAILAAAVIIAVNPGEQLAKARDATRERHVNAVESAIYTYHIDNLEFPSDLANSLGSEICNTNITPSNECGDLIDLSPLVEEGYLPQIPINPTTEKNTSSTGYNIVTIENKVAVWPTESETRQVGTRSALEFNGENDDYIEVGDREILKTKEDVTMMSWFKPYSGSLWESTMAILRQGKTYDLSYSMYVSSGGRLRFHWYDGENFQLIDSSANVITYDGWNHGVIVRKKNEIFIYVDGSLVGQGLSTTPQDAGGVLDIGNATGTTAQRFTGIIDDVRIYNRALSAQEIEYLYKGKNITDGLVGHWELSEGQGCTAYDHSGNNNHGTLGPDCINENAPEWVIGM